MTARATPTRRMAMLVESLDIVSPLAAFDGGLFVHNDMSTISERLIPVDLVAPVVELLGSYSLDV